MQMWMQAKPATGTYRQAGHRARARVAMAVIAAIMTVAVFGTTAAADDGACPVPDGSAECPWLISNAAGLAGMQSDVMAHYKLVQNIDLTEFLADKSWTPIGTAVNPFRGTLDGDGYAIEGLVINAPGSNEIGLFGHVGADGVIKNVTLEDVDIVGGSTVGAVAAINAGLIDGVRVTGTVSGSRSVGGLVGRNESGVSSPEINNSEADVTVSGGTVVGGLVGSNSGVIRDSQASGTVSHVSAGGSVDYFGGLVGSNSEKGKIFSSSASVQVTGGQSTRYVGGLAGRNDGGEIANSSASGDVSVGRFVGGLVGLNSGKVTDSWATGKVSGSYVVGGLAGEN